MREPTCPFGINFHEMWEASAIPCEACLAIRDAYRRGYAEAAEKAAQWIEQRSTAELLAFNFDDTREVRRNLAAGLRTMSIREEGESNE